jgi:hypothetical protein
MRIGDEVYSISEDGVMFLTHVEQIHKSEYDGPMVIATGEGLKIACTPNHGVAKLGGTKRKRDAKLSIVPFKDLPGQAYIVRSVAWKAQGTVHVVTPNVVASRTRRVQQPSSLSVEHYAELFGWMVTEGCTIDRDKAFSIAQMKEPQRTQIRNLLNQCGFKYGESKTGFLVHAMDWWAHFRTIGKCREKSIPAWLKCSDSITLRKLFNAMIDGDGHWHERETSGQFYTISRRLKAWLRCFRQQENP